MKKSLLIPVLLGLGSVSASATTVIDTFDTVSGTGTFTACGTAGASGSGSNTGTTNIGGANSRQVSVQISSLLGTANGCAEVRTTDPSASQTMVFNNGFGVFGTAQILWNPTGTVNLSAEQFLAIDVASDGGIIPDDVSTFTMLFCSNAATCTATGGSNLYSLSFTTTGQVFPLQTFTRALSSATQVGSVSWSSIDSIRMVVQSGNATDLVIDNVRLDNVPEPSTFALLGSSLAAFAMWRRRKA